jgi:hypothetical protein
LGNAAWTNIGLKTSGAPPPTVGNLVAGGQPFDAFLTLNGAWGGMPSGQLAVPTAAAAGYSASTLNSFVHGVAHSNLKTPFRLSAWLTNSAQLVMHLNSVSDGSIMIVRADGSELFRTNLPNLDGGYAVNNEYNLDIPVSLPAGKRLIEITNAGTDWFYLDSVRLQQVMPANYANNWQPSPEAIGLRGPHESLLYVVAPGVSFPAGATNSALGIQHAQTVTLTNWSAGNFIAEWYDPATAEALGTTQQPGANGSLTLGLPDFTSDIAVVLYATPRLSALDVSTNGILLRLDSETGGRYLLQLSFDLTNWAPLFTITNFSGSTTAIAPFAGTNAQSFFRVQKAL